MHITVIEWIRYHFRRMTNSIAFYPAIIGLGFLALSYLMISFDYTETGKNLKEQWDWLRMRDAETARSVISVIAAGILSLAVFNFSMVMLILNQAASQMSNRILDQLIGNRFQQIVLGFYIGTIVYSLFLLTAIRDIDEGIYVPSLSTYLLILFAVLDIFLFIYFLHYITQSVKYVVIIKRIFQNTYNLLKNNCQLKEEPNQTNVTDGESVTANTSGIMNGYNKEALIDLAVKNSCIISLLHPVGNFVLEGNPLLMITTSKQNISADELQEMIKSVYLVQETTLDDHFYYGLSRLTEVALRALSPGVNDPGTAVECLRSLAILLQYRMIHNPENIITDEKEHVRIVTKEYSFDELVEITIYPIWDYGKNDRMIQRELSIILPQLESISSKPSIRKLMSQLNLNLADKSF